MKRLTQKGFSLVELMVSLVLGSIVVLAAVQLFSTNQRTFQLQQAVSEVQETGRFTLEYLARDLRKVGLEDNSGNSSAGVITTNVSPLGGYAGDRSEDDANLAGDNDRLSFEFYGKIDCEGDSNSVTELIVNTYEVRTNADGVDELICEGSVDAGSTGAALISGVDSFQVLYGIDSSIDGVSNRADGIPFSGEYVHADEISSGDFVTSIRVALLVQTQQNNLPELAPNQSFTVLDKDLSTTDGTLNEVRLRRLFTTTVKVRNYDWETI